MQIIDSLVPIFSVIALGMVLRHKKFLTHESTQAFNRFAYFFALPLFLFYKLGSAPAVGSTANKFMLTLLTATVAAALAGWLICALMKTPFRTKGAFIQSCFRGNLAFMALPLILFVTYELPVDQRDNLEATVLIALPPIVILYNIGSVVVLSIFNKKFESGIQWKRVLKNLATNPLLIACIAGLLVQTLGVKIPTSIFRTCEVLGASAFPLALVGIGSQLASISVSSGQWAGILVSSGVKCVICPAVGWIAASTMGLAGIELKVILILCAVPTAVSSFVLADQMESDGDFAASSVVICTACSIVTLSILLALTG